MTPQWIKHFVSLWMIILADTLYTRRKIHIRGSILHLTPGKGQFSFQSKERQCQRMFKLPHSWAHFTLQQRNVQNSPSQALTVCELRHSRCSSWIQKRQRNQRSNFQHPLDHTKSKRIPEKLYLCLIDYAKAFDCVDHNKLWKIHKETGIPDHFTCLPRNLYADQEITVRTRHGAINGLAPN